MQEAYSSTCCPDAVDGGQDVLAVLLKLDTNKSLRGSAMDTVKTTAATALRKHQIQVGSIEPHAVECLQRVRARGRRAFGNHIEDKLVLASLRGLSTAVVGRMKHLNSDTFFNRWPVPVVSGAVLPRATEAQAETIFELGLQAPPQVEASDDGEESMEPTTLDITEGQVTPFPHEHHHVLTQELMHVFHSDVVIDITPGSGLKLLGALLSNGRASLRIAHRRQSVYIHQKKQEGHEQEAQIGQWHGARCAGHLQEPSPQGLRHAEPAGVDEKPSAGTWLESLGEAPAPG